jgi:predicted RNA-binding Zn-ribbon protein involved in translation (DUF1610 family)
MAEKQKRKFGEVPCPVCGTNLNEGRLASDRIDRTIVVCPKCGFQSPVLSVKQGQGIGSLWSIGILGLVAGVWLRTQYFFGLESTFSVIAFVVGGICLISVVAITIVRKKMIKGAKLKWESEHPAT